MHEEQLHGGVTSHVLRLSFDSGRTAIYKESVNAKPGMYQSEADGLRLLAGDGCPRTPEVYSVGEDHILIEDLGPQGDPPPGYWESFGRALARLHQRRAPRFGYNRPNYLGTMLLDNTWTDDGHAFFVETRLLCLLEKPNNLALLSADDRRAVEHVARRIVDETPYQPPSLVHGDLWTGNMLIADGGQPGLIDPAVYYGWPEADLAMLPLFEAIPPCFYDAYQELNPLEPGWRERFDLLAIRDPLCMVAEYGDMHDSIARLRKWLARAA